MLRIENIEPGSYAADLQLQPGDRLVSVNRRVINDLVDYHQALDAERLSLEVFRQDGEIWDVTLEKERFEELGLGFAHPQPNQCGNNCLFCFVHQLPKGLRRSLYVKDEDYRFSYLYGSYITLSNLQEADLERIIEQQLSPLYVSVHATDEAVRARLLGRTTPAIQPLLQRLTSAGISLHCQIVLCPGYNDGAVLRQSIEDLAALHPGVASLAVVPVGLTRHRQNLPPLQKLTPAQAVDALELIQRLQQDYLVRLGSRFVFAADEIYLQAQRPLPPLDAYEELPQLENGVGLIAQFRQQAEEVLLEADSLDLVRATLVTAHSFAAELSRFAERLALRVGAELDVIAIENEFFGSEVTVTGLLTGADLRRQLAGQDLGDGLLIPDVLLKQGEELFLDDMTLEQLEAELLCPVQVVETSPWGILDGLEALSADPLDIIRC